jgi:hypothetical protein
MSKLEENPSKNSFEYISFLISHLIDKIMEVNNV